MVVAVVTVNIVDREDMVKVTADGADTEDEGNNSDAEERIEDDVGVTMAAGTAEAAVFPPLFSNREAASAGTGTAVAGGSDM